MRTCFRSIAILCFALTTNSWGSPQQPAPESTTTFSTRADLVLVPVNVRRHGQHVPNLNKDSFTLLEDGRPQKIAVFEDVRTTTERLQRVKLPSGEFSNELLGDPNVARYTVIAIDRINTTTMDMNRLRQGLMKFLMQAVDSGEPVRLVAINPSAIQLIQDFTTSPKVLAAALQRMQKPAGRASVGNPQLNDIIHDMDVAASAADTDEQYLALERELDAQKTAEQQQIAFHNRSVRINSLEALQDLALSLAGLPGRKSVVWASSGYPFSGMPTEFRKTTVAGVSAGMTYDYGGVLEATGLDEYTMHLLNTGNIALYPVDARGTVNTAYEAIDPATVKNSPTYASKQIAQARNQDVITTFEHLAAATGGKPCYERSDLSGCFRDALDDARDYYMLGYYINRDKLKPGWHKLAVKVDEKGVSVRARNGFLLTKFGPEQSKPRDVALGLGSYLLDPGVPFRGQWTGTTARKDKKVVGLELVIPGRVNLVTPDQLHLNLEVAALARRQDGTVAAQFGQHVERNLPASAIPGIQQAGIAYKNVLELQPGKYLVRIVIRDNNTGKMGSVSAPLTVE